MRPSQRADSLDMEVLETPIGRVLLAATRVGLVRVLLLEDRPPHRAMRGLAHRLGLPVAVDAGRVAVAATQVDQFLRGSILTFDLPLDLRLANTGTRRVMSMLARVDYGATTTVRRLASATGRPFGARSTGAALALNPLPLVVPSHRVTRGRSGRRPRGDHPGGEDVQRYLLDVEASVVRSRHAAWTGEHLLEGADGDTWQDLQRHLEG